MFSLLNRYNTSIHNYIIFCIQLDKVKFSRNLNFVYMFNFIGIMFIWLRLITVRIIRISDYVPFFNPSMDTLYLFFFFFSLTNLWKAVSPIILSKGPAPGCADFFNFAFVYYIINFGSYCNYLFLLSLDLVLLIFQSLEMDTKIIDFQTFLYIYILSLFISL